MQIGPGTLRRGFSVTPERQAAYKQQALKSVAARASNKNAPGISMVAVSPHDLLEMLKAVQELSSVKKVLATWKDRRGTDNSEDGCYDELMEAMEHGDDQQ